MATKLFVKDGRMLVTNGKLRQCCCGNANRLTLAWGSVLYRYISMSTRYLLHRDRVAKYVTTWNVYDVDTWFCGAAAPLSLTVVAGLPVYTLTVDATNFYVHKDGVLAYTLAISAFTSAAIGTVFYSDSVTGLGTYYTCTIPDYTVTLTKG